MRFLALILALATPASAVPVITSITPNSGSVAGGTHVTIRGSGFSTCIICSPPVPPQVFFDGTPAQSAVIIDQTTIDAVTPPLLPATYGVMVRQFDGDASLAQAFTVTGDPGEAFETVLLPVYSPPVHGAFGSEFRTFVHASNKSDVSLVQLYGVDYGCLMAGPFVKPAMTPLTLEGTGITYTLPVDCSTWPARLLYVPKAQASSLTMNERVADVTRDATSHGTEIPIVREARFTNDRVVLLNVPIDARFRNTLRIYSPLQSAILVVVRAGKDHVIELQPGRTLFEPAYAVLSDFPRPEKLPAGETTIRVVVESPPGVFGSPKPPIWAFITVTNNETQQITTITPD